MMAIPISLEIDYVLRLWLGANVPEHAGLFTIIILFTSLINNLNSAISGVVHATGIMKNYQLWGSLFSICSVPISFFLLTVYPVPELALLTVLICSALGHLVCLFVVKRLVGMSVSEYLKVVIWPIAVVLIISIVIAYPVHLLMSSGFLRLCVVLIVSFLAVSFSLFFLAFNSNERALFTQMLKTAISKENNKRRRHDS